MALQLSTEDQFGNTNASAYHRIIALALNSKDKIASLAVEAYKDAAARAADKAAFSRRQYAISGDDYDTYFAPSVLDVVDQNPLERAYVFLKTLAEYDGASDV